MRILVIGGNGFIGSYMAPELVSSGHELAILHRHVVSGSIFGDTLQIQGDRNRLSDCEAQLRDFSPDIIVDLISSSGEQAEQVLNAADGIAARVVAISSMDVYRAWGVLHETEPGELEPLPMKEDSLLRTNRSLYRKETLKALQSVFSWIDDRYDKIAVEEVVMNHPGIAGTILRLPMIHGPGDRLHRLFPLLKRFADGRSTLLISDDLASWRCPRGYVENIAHAIALAATSEQAAGHIYNVCAEPCMPELLWETMIANQMQWPGKIVVLPREKMPKHLLSSGNTQQHVVVSSERIRKELGFSEIVGIEEALRRTVAWEQANPPQIIDPQQFNYEAEDAALSDAA